MNEVILEYRRKLDSLTPDKKRIWVVAHTMMNEMTVSEEAGAQDRWVACKRHYEASKAAENELLELLAAPAQSTSRGRATRGRATKGETARSLSGRDRMSDTFASGEISIVPVLRPKGAGWSERRPIDPKFSMGYPCRAFFHTESGLAVMSAVEVMSDEDKGPEYHISISKQKGRPSRCDSNEAKWVLQQFGLEGAEEDNHVHSGIVRNFWRTVSEPLIGLECKCKDEEPAIREDKGDFVWRPISKP